jgi:DNA-directed RNA polymerase specialized sigma24 family protein
VLLRYRDELDYRAIAERLDKTVTHVGVILHGALERLRRDARLREVVHG